MATSALSYARALRLTPHSNRANKLDGRDPRRGVRRPWEMDDDAERSPPHKPWERTGALPDADTDAPPKKPWEL